MDFTNLKIGESIILGEVRTEKFKFKSKEDIQDEKQDELEEKVDMQNTALELTSEMLSSMNELNKILLDNSSEEIIKLCESTTASIQKLLGLVSRKFVPTKEETVEKEE